MVAPALSVLEDILDVKPGRWRTVGRIVTACAVAEIIALVLVEGSTFWPILTVLILSAKNVGVTWQKSWHRMIGTVIGFGLAIALVVIFPQTPGGVLFTFIPIFIVCIYWSQTNATNPYAFFMVVVTMTVIVSPAWLDPEIVQQRGVHRFFETIIGIFAITFVSRCVFPVTAEAELRKSIHESLDRAGRRFESALRLLENPDESIEEVSSESRSSFSEKIDLLNAAISESHHVDQARGLWMARINLSNRVAIQSEMFLEQLTPDTVRKLPTEFMPSLIDSVKAIQEKWRIAGDALLDGEVPDIDHDSMNQIADTLEAKRGHGQGALRVNAVTTVIMMLRQLGEIKDILLYQEHVKLPSTLSQYGLIISAKNAIANINVDAMKLAVKATLATMLALVLVATLRWTDAMLTTAVTAILVIQPTMGASWSKSLQRVIGAAIGCLFGIAGLAIISANTNDFTWMLLYFSLGIAVAAWLMSGTWETSYVGLQIGICLSLVLGVAGPSADIESGIGRVAGILFGLCISLSVLRFLWPVWAGNQVCSAMANSCRSMARYLEVGLGNPEVERQIRPRGGWSYQILSGISNAFKYREEARYERGLTRAHAAPGLNLGVRLQALLPKIVLVVQARELRSLRSSIVQNPTITALRSAIEDRLELIAVLAEGGDGRPEPLKPLVDAAYAEIDFQDERTEEPNAIPLDEFLGYYNDMIPELDAMVDDARQLAELFSESKGISRLASSVS